MARQRTARLRARLGGTPSRPPLAPATHPLGLSGRRDGLLHVPAGASPDRPLPLVVMLHGAGGDAGQSIPLLVSEAEAHDVLVLAPESRLHTWDVIAERGYGADVAYLDAALAFVFDRFPVSRAAVAGFSDGASYGLCLGLANGDLFRDVLAFSPGFAAPDPIVGQPRVFISHGAEDRVLPVARCGRPLSERLRRAGYDVDYREFDGGHVAPAPLVAAAVDRFLS